MEANNTHAIGEIRPPRPEELSLLQALMLRSKAYWGYDAVFMEAVRADMTFPTDYMARTQVMVLDRAGRVVGFYGLQRDGEEAYLADLFVEPDAIGQGYGKQLWQHAVALARAQGAPAMRFKADPHAEPFYLRMGAQRIGQRESQVIPGRMLPLMLVDLSQ